MTRHRKPTYAEQDNTTALFAESGRVLVSLFHKPPVPGAGIGVESGHGRRGFPLPGANRFNRPRPFSIPSTAGQAVCIVSAQRWRKAEQAMRNLFLHNPASPALGERAPRPGDSGRHGNRRHIAAPNCNHPYSY